MAAERNNARHACPWRAFCLRRLGRRLGAFTPITGEAQGNILRPMFTGLALAQLGYTIRPLRPLVVEAAAGYLFRTDTVSFIAADIDDDSLSALVGGEFFLSLSWIPFSDLMFTVEGGVFLPQMGKVFTDDADIQYRLEFTAVFSF